MNFNLSEEQTMIRDSVARFVQDQRDPDNHTEHHELLEEPRSRPEVQQLHAARRVDVTASRR